jgi:hypothetical protein
MSDDARVPEYRAIAREVDGRVWPCWLPWAVMPILENWEDGAQYRLSYIHRGVAVYDRLYGARYLPPMEDA